MIKETRGIETVEDSSRYGTVRDVGWVWFGANIGVLSIVYGGLVAGFGLNFVQALLAAVVGTFTSFIFVGLVSVAGAKSGQPTLALSRSVFGTKGNMAPTVISWVSILGWEVIASVIAAWSLSSLLSTVFSVPDTSALEASSLLAVVALALIMGIFGHAAIIKFQKIFSIAFGALTLLILPFLIFHSHGPMAIFSSQAPFGAVVAVTSIIAAGTGISWINLAGDYSRYLPETVSNRSIVLWVTLAASFPTVILIMVGYYCASSIPTLTTSLNPIHSIGSALPGFCAVPFLLAGLGGMLAETDLACYSSGLNLLALGIKIPRSRTVVIDAAVVLFGGLVVLLGHSGFITPFESFLQVLADGLAPWGAVIVANMLVRRQLMKNRDSIWFKCLKSKDKNNFTFGFEAILSWLTGIAVALSTTVCPWFEGPLVKGFLSEGSFGFFFGGFAAFIFYLIFTVISKPNMLNTTDAELKNSAFEFCGSAEGLEGARLSIKPSRYDTLFIEPSPKRLIVVGSILVDVMVYVDSLPERGSDTFASDKRITSGGGFNVCSASKRMGLESIYLGRVGDGPFGRQVARDLEFEGIAAPLGFIHGEDSGFTVGVVEAGGERTFLTAGGTESKLEPGDLAGFGIRPGDAVYISGYDLLYPISGRTIFDFANRLGKKNLLVVDPGPLAAETKKSLFIDLLPRVNVLSLNEREAQLIGGSESPEANAKLLAGKIFGEGVVIVRVGDRGCWICSPGGLPEHIHNLPMVPVDTTGAGDVHVGALIASFARGADLYSAAHVANLAAGYSVSRIGGATGPRIEDLLEVAKKA